jgi:hypothetical protein
MAEVEIPDPHELREKAENPFTKLIALFVAIYAVGLAIASFGASNVTKELLLLKQEQSRVEAEARQKAQNEWNQFQSKSTREAMYKNQATLLEFEKNANPKDFPVWKETQLKYFREEEVRMKTDKTDLAKVAGDLTAKGEAKVAEIEATYHKFERKDPYFDFAEVMFQLAIVLASVAMLAEKKWAFVLSLILAVCAFILMINGFGLFFKIGLLEGGH